MLDSGANAFVRYVQSLDYNQRMEAVELASGEQADCNFEMGPKGIPTCLLPCVRGAGHVDLLPLCWLVNRHCSMSDDFKVLETPCGNRLQIVVIDRLHYLAARDVETLFEDLPGPEVAGRDGTTALEEFALGGNSGARRRRSHVDRELLGAGRCQVLRVWDLKQQSDDQQHPEIAGRTCGDNFWNCGHVQKHVVHHWAARWGGDSTR